MVVISVVTVLPKLLLQLIQNYASMAFFVPN